MNHYRLYPLDPESLAIIGPPRILTAHDDREAVQSLKPAEHPVELWCRGRFIGRFPAKLTKDLQSGAATLAQAKGSQERARGSSPTHHER